MGRDYAIINFMKHKHQYTNNTLNNAKKLRSEMTIFERKLWYHLRAKRFMNTKFKRQVPIGPYIVDFVCKDKKIIIELDGSGHLETSQKEHDTIRDNYLKNQGYEIIRFFNNDIENNLESVLEVIRQKILSP